MMPLSRRHRFITLPALGIVIVGLLLAGVLAWTVLTSGGARVALSAVSSATSEKVLFRGIDGRLCCNLAIEEIHISAAPRDIVVRGFRFDWHASLLLAGRLVVDRIAADDVLVIGESAPADEPGELPQPPAFPDLPLDIRVARLSLATLRMGANAEDAAPVLRALSAALAADARAVTVSAFSVTAADWRVDGALNWAAPVAEGLRASVRATGTLDNRAQTLTIDINGPFSALEVAAVAGGRWQASVNAQATLTDPPGAIARIVVTPEQWASMALPSTLLAPLKLTAELDPSRVAIALGTRIDAGAPADNGSGVQASAEPGAADLALNLRAPLPATSQDFNAEFDWQFELPAMALAVDGRGDVTLSDKVVTLEQRTAAPWQSVLTGSIDTAPATPTVNARLAGGPWRTDAFTTAVTALDTFEVTVDGSSAAWQLALDAGAAETTAGPVALTATASGGPDAVNQARATLTALGGSVDLTGAGTWADGLRANVDIAARDLDLAVFAPDLRTRLGADAGLKLASGDAGLSTEIELRRLDGAWRDYTVEARGRARTTPEMIDIEALVARIGDNRLELTARNQDVWRGTVALDVPELAQIAAGFAGRVAARGEFSGTPAAPRFHGELEGTALATGDFRVAEISGTWELNGAPTQHSSLDLKASGVTAGPAADGQLAVALAGNAAAHTLAIDVSDAGLGEAGFVLAGSFAPAGTPPAAALTAWRRALARGWSGRVDTLDLDADLAGRWTMPAPATLRSRERGADSGVAVEALCLVQERDQARVCVDSARLAPDATSLAGVTVHALPLRLAQPWLPRHIALGGVADAAFDWHGDASGPHLRGRAETRDGSITVAGEESAALRTFTLDLDHDSERTHFDLVTVVEGWVELTASADLSNAAKPTVDANISARAPGLDWVAEFVPQLSGTQGAAALDARLSGAANAPEINLDLRLTEGRLRLPDTGMTYDTLAVTAQSNAPGRARFDGRIGAGDKLLTFNGHIEQPDGGGFAGAVAARAAAFPVVRLPDIEADISPDLTLSFDRSGTDIRGRVELPHVAVTVNQVPPSAVTVSEDVVIIEPGAPAGAATEPTPGYFAEHVTGDVQLELGDSVRVAALGLTARLAGGLRWTKSQGDDYGLGEGRIRIAEGGFDAYGQRLRIDRGELVFAGAIDHPQIDVRASRPDIAVTAGVAVTGDMREPRLALFSSPAMADNEILSYILTGRGFDDASSSEGALIARAALSLGAERSSVVTSRVQEAFGLDDLSVDTGDTLNATSIGVAKRLSPRLALRSSFNPFDRLWSLFVTYKLTANWSVQAESGERQGADLLYSIERETFLPANLLRWDEWLSGK